MCSVLRLNQWTAFRKTMFPLGRDDLCSVPFIADTGVTNMEVRSTADANWHSLIDLNGDPPLDKKLLWLSLGYQLFATKRPTQIPFVIKG